MKFSFSHLLWLALAILIITAGLLTLFSNPSTHLHEHLLTTTAMHRSFDVEVRCVGELDALRSTLIMSPIRGDLGKIISLVADGTYVKPDDLLVKLDPTPFEEAVSDLQSAIREQECKIKALQQSLESEVCQIEHETKTCEFEVRCASLELDKIVKGDGPQELARLKSAMQKAMARYTEIQGYSKELQELEEEGFLSSSERLQAAKKLAEEEEVYEIARLEHDSFVNYVLPMRIEKAQTTLKRTDSKLEEISRIGAIKVLRDKALIEHAKEELSDLKQQLQNAIVVLKLTDIRAPASGIVVLKEDYRNGQRRKPRVGDQVIRNQPILDLPDLDAMIVKTKVREADLHKIQIGKRASVSLDAYPNLHLKGDVASIGILALSDIGKMGDEKYFDVQIHLTEGDPRLRPGMTARLAILSSKVDNSLSLPTHAIFENGNGPFCYLRQNDSFVIQPLTLGVSNEQWVDVLSGINEGDEISLTTPPKEYLSTPP